MNSGSSIKNEIKYTKISLNSNSNKSNSFKKLEKGKVINGIEISEGKPDSFAKIKRNSLNGNIKIIKLNRFGRK